MINLKGLKKLFILLLLASQIFSCDTSCVEADEFSIIPINLDSNMRNMKVGVFGDYNHNDGGQRSEWYDTGIRTNGSKITLTLVGGWIYTGGSLNSTQADVDSIPLCNYCSKDIADPNPTQNCICHNYNGQVPSPIIRDNGLPTTCNSSDHSNPNLCTCFNRGLDSVTQYGVYHQSLNSLAKTSNNDRIALRGDKQSVCRMNRGMGAYIALWGANGAQTPNRAYHLYTHREYCPVPRGPNGECEKNGVNVLRYVYESPNNTIFIKDDGVGNSLPTVSTSAPGFQYHGPNEVVKLIVYDGFYDDNAGKYSIYFVGGFGSEKTNFILEFITGLFEDVLLGAKNSEGERVGGVLEFFYNSVVNNPPFQMTVQFMLVLYIVFFGGSYLMGVVDITRKEVSLIIMKIALIVMFTNPLSWGMYKSFIVNFFKDGMDQLMAMIMMTTDTATGESSNLNYIAQGGRAIDGSNATRFSYPDLIMKKLLSPAVAKKLLGVIGDGNIYGIIYFLVTYALIFYFIYVMLLVCSIYIVCFLKMILLLGLGPIFISLALFSKTNDMFKSWLSFLGSRALEMAILFLVLSPFLMSIDRYFTDLLYYRVCGVQKGIPPLYLIILQTSGLDRSLFEWLLMFLKIATVIFIMQTILDRVPQMAGQLISIGGIPNQDTTSKVGYGASGFGLAINAANAAIFGTLGAIKEAANFSLNKSGLVPTVIGGATAIARKTGIASAWNAIGKKIPFRGPRTRMRDMVIEGALKEARAQGISNKLSGKELDKFVRDTAMANLAKRIAEDPVKMAMLGVDAKNISKVMDRVLVRDGLKDFLKDRAQELKSEGLVGKEMRQRLREDAKEWAKNNLYDTGGLNKVDNYLKDRSIRSFLRSNAEYSSSEAAKIFTTPQDRAKYLEHLEDLKYRNQKKWENAKRNPVTHMVPYLLSRAKHEIIGDTKGNPNLARENFDRKAHIEENGRPTWARYLNPVSHINFLDRRLNKEKFEETRQLHDELLQGRLREKIVQDEDGIGEVNQADKKAVRRQKAKKIGQRDMMKDKLRELAIADIERQLNKEPDYEDYSKPFSDAGSYERKEQLQEKLLKEMFEDDGSGKTLFEKAVQYDYLVGKEHGKASMEQLVAQASFNDVKELSTKMDSMSLDNVLKERENIAKNDVGKGFFAKKLDLNKHGKLIQDGISGNFESENLFGSKPNSIQDESATGNQISKDYENKVRDQLEAIDKRILDKISEQADLYQEEVDRLDENFDQIIENSKSAEKRKANQKKFAKSLRSFANTLESSLGGDITQGDSDVIDGFRAQADILDKADPVSVSSLPRFDDSFISNRTNLNPKQLDEIKKGLEGLEKDRSAMQADIDQSRIRPVNLAEMSPRAMGIERENVAKSSNDVDYKLQDMLSEIALFKGQNSIRFDSGDLAINQRNIAVLNQEFDQTRLSDSSYILPQLDKNIGALRSIDNTYLGISSDARGALGVDKSIEFNQKLKDSMTALKSDIEQGKAISPDQMKARVDEISQDRAKAINLYDKATSLFKVEDALQKTKSEISQVKEVTVEQAPRIEPPIAQEAPRYIAQKASPLAQQNSSSGLEKFTNRQYDQATISDNSKFSQALKDDLAFVNRAKSVNANIIKTDQDSGISPVKNSEMQARLDNLSIALDRGLKTIESAPEGTIDLSQNKRIAEGITDLKDNLTKTSVDDLAKISSLGYQKNLATIEKYDSRVSSMIKQERYSDPVVSDQVLFNKAMQQDLQDFQHLQRALNSTNSSATYDKTKQLSDDIKAMSSSLQDKIAKTEDRQTGSQKLSPQDLTQIVSEVKDQRQEFFARNLNEVADVSKRYAQQQSNQDLFFANPKGSPIIPVPTLKSPPIPAPKRSDQVLPDQTTPPKAQDSPSQPRTEARSDYINTQSNKLENAGEFRDSGDSRDSSPAKATDVFKSPSYSSLTDSQGKIDVDKFSSNIQKDIVSLSEISRQAIAVQDTSALGNDANRKMANLQSIASDFQKNQNNPNLTPSQKEEISKNLAEVADQFKDSIVKNEGYKQQAGLNQFGFASLKQNASSTSDIFQSPSYSSLKDFQGNVDSDKFAKALEKDIGKILEINQLAKSTNDLSGLDKFSESKARELLDVAVTFDRVLSDSETSSQFRQLVINTLAQDADRIKREFVETKSVKEQAGLNQIIYSKIKSADSSEIKSADSSAPSQALPRFTASPQEVRDSQSRDAKLAQQSQPQGEDRNPLTYLPPIKGVPSPSDSRPKSPPIPAPKRDLNDKQTQVPQPQTPSLVKDQSSVLEVRPDPFNRLENKLENAGDFRDLRDLSPVKATDVFQSPSYSSLMDSQGKIDVDKFSSSLQKDITSLSEISRQANITQDLSPLGDDARRKIDDLRSIAGEVIEVKKDGNLSPAQKESYIKELAGVADEFKNSFVKNEGYKQQVDANESKYFETQSTSSRSSDNLKPVSLDQVDLKFDVDSKKSFDVFEAKPYAKNSELNDANGFIDNQKLTSAIQKDIASLEKIQDRSQQLGDVGIATQSTDLKDKLAGVVSQVKEVASDNKLAKEQKQAIYAELSLSVDDLKKPFVENQQIKDSVSSDRYLVDKASPSRDSASLDQPITLDRASLPPSRPLPQIPTKPVIKDGKDSTLESPKDPKIQNQTTPRIDPYSDKKNKLETISPPFLPLGNPREQEQSQQDLRELKVPQNPQELKELLQRNIDGLQMLQSRLNAIKSKTLSDVELRSKITKIGEGLQDKIEIIDRLPADTIFRSEIIDQKQLQQITAEVEKEKTEIMRNYDGSLRKVGDNMSRQMVADSALSTKLSYSKGDIFKDIDVSVNPAQKELGADVSNVDRQIRAIEEINMAKSNVDGTVLRIEGLDKVGFDFYGSLEQYGKDREALLNQKLQIDKLYLKASKQIESSDPLSAIDKTFEQINQAQGQFKKGAISFVEELGKLTLDPIQRDYVDKLSKTIDETDTKIHRKPSEMLYEDRLDLFDKNQNQIREKLITENTRTEELFATVKEASEISQDKSLKKLVEQLSDLRKSEEKLLQDFDDFGKIKEGAKFDLQSGDKDKEKELKSLFDTSVSQRYDEIKESRQNLIKTMKEFDQSDQEDRQYKFFVAQESEVRVNPYKSENYLEKTGLATKNLEDILRDPEVRDSLTSVGLGVKRYEELKDADEKVQDMKQSLSRPSVLSQITRDPDQDGSSFKDLSIAKIESLKEQSKFVKEQVNAIGDSELLSSQQDFNKQKTELVSQQERLENLYSKAQDQIDKGSSLKDIDNTMKDIRKAQDDFVFESKFFTQEALASVNSKINSGQASPDLSRDLEGLSVQLNKVESQTNAFDKAKISESTIDFVAPNRYENFEKSKDAILQEVVNDKMRIDDFQQSLQQIASVSKDEKITTLISDTSGISKSQNDVVKEIQQLAEQPSIQNRKSQVDELVFKLDDLSNRQRKLVDEYVKNNSVNPELLESIDRFKLSQEFYNAEKMSQFKSRSEEIRTAGLASNFESMQQTAIYQSEARHEQLVGITKALIATKISDALINSDIKNVLPGGSIKNALLGGGGSGLPMIGGGYLGDNSNKEIVANASELEAQKKLTALSSKMDKLNIKIISSQLSKLEDKKSLTRQEKITMMSMKDQLDGLKSSLSKKQMKMSEINKILSPSE